MNQRRRSPIYKNNSPRFSTRRPAERDIIENKAYWEDIKKQATSVLESIDAEQKKLLDSGKTAGIEPAIVTAYKTAKADIDKATEALKAYDSYEKRQSAADKQQTKSNGPRRRRT